MRDKILEILKEYDGGDFCGNDECHGWRLKKEEAEAILDLLYKSLPREIIPAEIPHHSPHISGYNEALADVRKVIKEK